MAADGVSEITIKLLHGKDSHRVKLVLPEEEHGDVLTVGHLAKAVEEITGVPIPRQKIVHKGVLLSEMRKSLKNCGVSKNAKIMLNGTEPLPEEEPNWIAFKEIKAILDKYDNEFSQVIHEVDGVHRGYMSSVGTGPSASALRKLGTRVQDLKRKFNDIGMNIQSLKFDECNKRGPAEREALYKKLDHKINQCDSIIRGITEMLVKGDYMAGKLCCPPNVSGFRRTF